MSEKIKEVFVFGTDKFIFHRGVRMRYSVIYPPPRSKPYEISDHMVEIYNEKFREWQPYPCNEAIVPCPVCGRKIKAYYIPGTTWIAFCSEVCRRKYREKR